MLISVCVPAFCAEQFIGTAVTTALSSRGRGTNFDLQVVVVDDASTDGTREIVEEFARRDADVHLYSNTRRLGIGGNVNRALELASGTLLTILPADCALTHDGLLLRTKELSAAPDAAMCWGSAEFIDQSGRTAGGAVPRRVGRFTAGAEALSLLLPWNPVYPSTALFTRAAYEATGGYRWEITASHMDWDMFIRMSVLGSTIVIPSTVAQERIHEGNYTAQAVASGRTPLYEVIVLQEARRWVSTEHPELSPVVERGMREWTRSRIADAALARAGLRSSSPSSSIGLGLAVSVRGFLSPRSVLLLVSMGLPKAVARMLLSLAVSRRNRRSSANELRSNTGATWGDLRS